MIKRVPVSMSFDSQTIENLKTLVDETKLTRSEIIRHLIRSAFYNPILVDIVKHQHQIEKEVEEHKIKATSCNAQYDNTKKEMGMPDGNTQEPSSLSIDDSLIDYLNPVNYRHALKNCHTQEEIDAVIWKRNVQLARYKWVDKWVDD